MKKTHQSYFKDKTIWITGASSGIGEAISRYLDTHCDCHLVLSGRNTDKLSQLSQTFKNTVTISAFDVTKKEDCLKAVQNLSKSTPIDIIILNAGNCYYVEPKTFNSNDHEAMIKINYLSMTYLIEGLLPHFLDKNQGHIVTVSSLAALLGFPRSSAYGASKAASLNFTECLQQDLEKTNIAITSVLPGFVKTPLTDKNDFEMISVVSAEFAAKKITADIANKELQSTFPFVFSLFLKFIACLPAKVKHKIIYSTTKK